MNHELTAHTQKVYEFSLALIEQRFSDAYDMLSSSAKNEISEKILAQELAEMIEYGDGPAAEFVVVQVMTNWPGKEASDIGWVYVAIWGPEFSEAITVIVAQEAGESVVRDIEWGRP